MTNFTHKIPDLPGYSIESKAVESKNRGMDPKLIKFLNVVKTARFRDVPKVWNDQLRAALGDNLVGVGWGGVIELTNAGEIAARQHQKDNNQ